MKLTKVSGRVGRLAMVMAIGIGLAVSAQAQTLLVDFGRGDPGGSFRGVTVPNPDANGNTWNSLTPGPFYGGLVDVSGADHDRSGLHDWRRHRQLQRTGW